jgi:putative endonuclease
VYNLEYVLCIFAKKSKKQKYYCGYTNDLVKRCNDHNQGLNKSTKPYTPWKLVYYEAYQTSQAALNRERVLKNHGRTLFGLKIRAETGRSI